MPITSQATRRLIENIQQARQAPQVNRTNYATAPSVIGPTANPQDIQKFEAEVNSPDYPEELKRLYQTAKATNNYNDFNQAVGRYNLQSATAQTQAQASISAFQKTVDSPDYPAELRSAFYRAKDAGDFSTFNTAIEDYNAKNKAEYDKWTTEQAKVKEIYTSARENYEAYIKAHPELLQGGPSFTDNQISDLERGLQYLPPEQRDAVQKVIDDAKRRNYGTVQVGGGEYISKFDYEKIAQSDEHNGTRYLEILKDSGVTGLNAVYQDKANQRNADFNAWLNDNIKSDTYLNDIYLQKGEQAAIAAYDKRYKDLQGIYDRWVDKNIKSDKYLKQVYDTKGEKAAIDAFNRRTMDLNDIEMRKFQRDYHVINGVGIKKEDWEALPQELKDYATKRNSFDDMFDMMDMWDKNPLTAPQWYLDELNSPAKQRRVDDTMSALESFKDKDGNYNLIAYMDSLKTVRNVKYGGFMGKAGAGRTEVTNPDFKDLRRKLIEAGFDAKAVDDSIYQAKLDKVQRFWQKSTPWNEQKGETVTFGRGMQMAAEWLIPGVYVGTHWKEMSPGQRAFSLVFDVISIALPAAKAATIGAREVAGTATRAGVMAAATRGFVRGAAAGALGSFDVILHPWGTAKASAADLRNLAEDIANPKKLPAMSVYTSEGTVRLKITKDMTPAEAMAARDSLMEAVKNGERVFIRSGNTVLELRRSALMKELPGGLVHTSPQGENFLEGLIVKVKEGKPPKEQGLFVSPDPLPRFARTSAFGETGDQPMFFIMSPRTAAKTVKTDKLYQSYAGLVAEMERKLPVGEETKAVGQKLYTRIGPEGTRVEIWLEEGSKLSPTQIAKLKAKGIFESLMAPFSPALMRKRGRFAQAGIDIGQARILANELERAGAKAEARELIRAARLLNSSRVAAPRLILRAGEGLRQSRHDRTPENRLIPPTRPSDIPSRDDLIRISRGTTRRDLKNLRKSTGGRFNRRTQPQINRGTTIRNTDTRTPVETRAGQETRRPPTEQPERSIRTEVPRNTPNERTPGRDINRTPVPPRGTNRISPPGRTNPPRPPRPPEPPRFPPPSKPPYLRLKNGSDKDKRAAIINAGGAIAFNMGEVGSKGNRKRVWPTVKNDYNSNDDALVVVGEPPQGATIIQRGKGSAKATAQLIRGKMPQKAITADYGMMDIKLIPGKGRKLTAHFTPDPMQRTTSDINFFPNHNDDDEKLRRDLDNYGKPPRDLRITPKDLRISPREMRITPKEKPITPREKRLK